jgi:hypothetical protein
MHHRCRCSGRLPSFFDLDTLSRQSPYRLLCFSADRWVTWLLKALASSWTCRHPFRTACPSWFWRWGNMALDCFRRVQGKSAYTALFDGTTKSPHHGSIWKCWAPLKCRIFARLASLDRCWTAELCMRHNLADETRTLAFSAIRKRSRSHICWHNALLHSRFGTISFQI